MTLKYKSISPDLLRIREYTLNLHRDVKSYQIQAKSSYSLTTCFVCKILLTGILLQSSHDDHS